MAFLDNVNNQLRRARQSELGRLAIGLAQQYPTYSRAFGFLNNFYAGATDNTTIRARSGGPGGVFANPYPYRVGNQTRTRTPVLALATPPRRSRMPIRRPTRWRRHFRRRYRARRGRAVGPAVVGNQTRLFPNSMVTTMQFLWRQEIHGNATVPETTPFNAIIDPDVVHVFKATSVFDPYEGTLAREAHGWTTMANIYDHFVVLGSTIRVQYNWAQPDSMPLTVGIALRDSESKASSAQHYELNSKQVSTNLPGTLDNSSGIKSLRLNYDPRSFFHVKNVNEVSALRGSYTGPANPGENAYFHCWCAPMGTTDMNTGTLIMNVEITYRVLSTEPKTFAVES